MTWERPVSHRAGTRGEAGDSMQLTAATDLGIAAMGLNSGTRNTSGKPGQSMRVVLLVNRNGPVLYPGRT